MRITKTTDTLNYDLSGFQAALERIADATARAAKAAEAQNETASSMRVMLLEIGAMIERSLEVRNDL